MICQRETNLRDPFLVIVAETRAWNLIFLSNYWIDLNDKKTWFLLILIQVLSYVVAGFYNCKLPLNVLLYISIFVFRARAWLSKRSILSAEEGKSFMLKTYSIKVCLLLLSCQHHSYMKQGAKIMILYNLEIPSFCKYT